MGLITRRQYQVLIPVGKAIPSFISVKWESGAFKQCSLVAEVDVAIRQAIILNHSGHSLNARCFTPRKDSTHVEQKGSLVTPERLRWTFSARTGYSGTNCASGSNCKSVQIRQMPQPMRGLCQWTMRNKWCNGVIRREIRR